MSIQPYLFFEGRAEEAFAFYENAIDAKVEMLMRYKDSPDKSNAACMPANQDLVMHASIRIGDGIMMASDGFGSGKPNFHGFSLSVSAKDEAEAKTFFDRLSEGGQVQQPLVKTFFSPAFGMVADKFGISWMVIVPQ